MDPVRATAPRWRARTLAIVTVGTVAAGLVLWLNTKAAGPDLMVSGVPIRGVPGLIVLTAYTLIAVVVAALGLAIASRVPKNAIGWILLGVGSWAGVTFFIGSLLAYLAGLDPGRTGLADFSVWLGRWTFVPVVSVPITFVLMLVPNGHLLSARWRILPWLAGIGIAGWTTLEAFSQEGPVRQINPFPNPTLSAVGEAANLALAAAFVGSALSVFLRFRRADQQTRQQIKWVVFGGSVEVTVTIVLWILSEVRPSAFGPVAIAIGSVSGLATPLANAVAILRYRLYDIDRLINRTVTYGAVVGLLAAIYGLVAIGLPQLLHLPADTPLLVAMATLASFALFRPATRWVQSAIDRRFNRAHYDARREVEGFSSQLTHRVAMDEVVEVTASLLNRTLQPNELGVWIRNAAAPVQPSLGPTAY